MVQYDFYNFDPKDFLTLDISAYSGEAIREMAYFLWCCYQQDETLMLWRSTNLLPLVKLDEIMLLSETEED